jgi:hypothetical protein
MRDERVETHKSLKSANPDIVVYEPQQLCLPQAAINIVAQFIDAGDQIPIMMQSTYAVTVKHSSIQIVEKVDVNYPSQFSFDSFQASRRYADRATSELVTDVVEFLDRFDLPYIALIDEKLSLDGGSLALDEANARRLFVIDFNTTVVAMPLKCRGDVECVAITMRDADNVVRKSNE